MISLPPSYPSVAEVVSLFCWIDNAELYWLSLDAKHKIPFGVCNCSRQSSSLAGTKKVDFTDLT